jgi:molecular chaperone HscB
MTQNYFELFQLLPQYDVDFTRLKARYYELQQQFHPDKQDSAADKRQALQFSALINDAYQTLQCHIRRASYLLDLLGVDLEIESNTQLSPTFLMAQMDLRETLEGSRHDKVALKAFVIQVDALIEQEALQLAAFCQNLPETSDSVKNLIREMLFYKKLKAESEQMLWQC